LLLGHPELVEGSINNYEKVDSAISTGST